MEKEIKVRKKRFVAFWVAALVICGLTVPMIANAVDYVNDSGAVAQGEKLTVGTEIRAQKITYLDEGGNTIATGTQRSGGWQTIADFSGELPAGKNFTYWLVQSVSAETTPAESGYGDVRYPVLVTLSPVFETIVYTITFNTDGGTAIDPITIEHGETVSAPVTPSKEGYEFDKWSVEFPYTVTEDITITASWNINKYTITFNTDGGTAIEPITQDFGTDVTVPPNPTKDEYIFDGWDPQIPSTMPAQDMTIKAKWKSKYVIEKGTHELTAGVKYQLGSGVTQVSNDPSTYASGAYFYVPKDGTYTFN